MVDDHDNIDWNAVFAGIAHTQNGDGQTIDKQDQSQSQSYHVADIDIHRGGHQSSPQHIPHQNQHQQHHQHQQQQQHQSHQPHQSQQLSLPHPLPGLQQPERRGDNVWENFFPPPIVPASSTASTPTGQIDSRSQTPRSIASIINNYDAPGPSTTRPRQVHRNTLPLPYSAPAPNPTYGSGGGHDHLFSHLAHSLYLPGPSAIDEPRAISNESDSRGDRERESQGRGRGRGVDTRHSFDGATRDFSDRDAWTYDIPPQQLHPHSAGPPSSGFPYNPLPSAPTWTTYTSPTTVPPPSRGSNVLPDTTPSSTSSTPAMPQQAPTPLQVVPDTPGGGADSEDKRQRNTLASAKFRAKRKKHVENVSRRITELENEHSDLTRDVSDLRQENKFLREMVELKYGLDVPPEDLPPYLPDDQDELED